MYILVVVVIVVLYKLFQFGINWYWRRDGPIPLHSICTADGKIVPCPIPVGEDL